MQLSQDTCSIIDVALCLVESVYLDECMYPVVTLYMTTHLANKPADRILFLIFHFSFFILFFHSFFSFIFLLLFGGDGDPRQLCMQPD